MSQFNKHISKQMTYEQLKKGYRIDYKFIQDEQLKYATSPIYQTKREVNIKLKELHEDKNVQEFVVTVVRFHIQ